MTRATRTRSRAARKAHMVRRLVALAAELTAADLAAGLAWYDRARAAAEGLAIGGDIAGAAATIAHLSPRESWSRNVANAARVLAAAADGAACPAVHTTGQRAKAWAAATGVASPDADHGPKTLRFYLNIMGDTAAVCVDSWAARAATGDLSHEGPGSAAEYALMEDAYVQAAAIVGLAPRDLQAAVWVHVRGAAD